MVDIIKCQFCERTFVESIDGLTIKTFHEATHEPELVNKSTD